MRAQDENGRGLGKSFATLKIKILDVNDNKPEVDDYETDIFELAKFTTPDLFVQVSELKITEKWSELSEALSSFHIIPRSS